MICVTYVSSLGDLLLLCLLFRPMLWGPQTCIFNCSGTSPNGSKPDLVANEDKHLSPSSAISLSAEWGGGTGSVQGGRNHQHVLMMMGDEEAEIVAQLRTTLKVFPLARVHLTRSDDKYEITSQSNVLWVVGLWRST